MTSKPKSIDDLWEIFLETTNAKNAAIDENQKEALKLTFTWGVVTLLKEIDEFERCGQEKEKLQEWLKKLYAECLLSALTQSMVIMSRVDASKSAKT